MKKLLIPFLFLVGCSVTDTQPEILPIELELDARLPIDENGYYHLTLNPYKNQTVHRITGKVKNQQYITKVDWESNLYWWLLEGEIVANITKTYINYYTGQLVYINLPPLTNWKDLLVPTVNPASYSSETGEVNVMIAPIYRMKGDTLIVTGFVTESDEEETVKIVLE